MNVDLTNKRVCWKSLLIGAASLLGAVSTNKGLEETDND